MVRASGGVGVLRAPAKEDEAVVCGSSCGKAGAGSRTVRRAEPKAGNGMRQ